MSKIGKKLIRQAAFICILGLFFSILVCAAVLFPALKDNMATDSQNITSQITTRVDNTLSNIRSFGLELSDIILPEIFEDYDSKSKDAAYQAEIKLKLNNYIAPFNNIYGIGVTMNDGDVFKSILLDTGNELEQPKLREWYHMAQTTDNYEGFSGPVMSDGYYGESTMISYYYTAFSLPDSTSGSILLRFNMNDLIHSMEQSNSSFQEFVWTDGNFEPFYQSDRHDNIDRCLEKKETSYLNAEDLESEGIITASLLNCSWHLFTYVSYSKLLGGDNTYLVLLILFAIFYILLSVLLMIPVISRLVRPIRNLTVEMQRSTGDSLNTVSVAKTNDEIEELCRQFNSLTLRLEENIRQIIKDRKEKEEMKYNLLIAQMDPHFIYNTMNTVTYLARRSGAKDIVEINTAFIKMLKDKLRIEDVEIFDSLVQEIKIIEAYCVIQKYKYQNRVVLEWDIDSAAKGLKVPKSILQPLVENAYYHGISMKEDEEGKIKITVRQTENRIHIRVKDNGAGIPSQELELLNRHDWSKSKTRKGKGIGLSNIYKRLSYIYDGRIEMSFESKPDIETVVSISFPKHSEFSREDLC